MLCEPVHVLDVICITACILPTPHIRISYRGATLRLIRLPIELDVCECMYMCVCVSVITYTNLYGIIVYGVRMLE